MCSPYSVTCVAETQMHSVERVRQRNRQTHRPTQRESDRDRERHTPSVPLRAWAALRWSPARRPPSSPLRVADKTQRHAEAQMHEPQAETDRGRQAGRQRDRERARASERASERGRGRETHLRIGPCRPAWPPWRRRGHRSHPATERRSSEAREPERKQTEAHLLLAPFGRSVPRQHRSHCCATSLCVSLSSSLCRLSRAAQRSWSCLCHMLVCCTAPRCAPPGGGVHRHEPPLQPTMACVSLSAQP